MKIIGLFIMKWKEENPFFLCSAYELGFLSWYQRSFFKETLNFGARTCASRVKLGERTAVHMEEAKAVCYICVDPNGIASLVVADDEYPGKVAFVIINEMFREFYKEYDQMYLETVTKDSNLSLKKLDEYIKSYQDPKEADKLLKLEFTLKEVTNIVHKNLEDLMKRGESLDSLMSKSKDISSVSYDFYKKARQTNKKCCSLY